MDTGDLNVLGTLTGDGTDLTGIATLPINLSSGVTGILSVTNGGTGISTSPLTVALGGTGATAAANAANGVVVLNASSQLPAVDGSLLTGLSAVTQVNDTDAGTAAGAGETTFLSVAKTITAGKTVLLIATGYNTFTSGTGTMTLKLYQGVSVVQTILLPSTTPTNIPWSCSGIVTGLSGSITFSVSITQTNTLAHTAYGNLEVLEF